MGARDATLVEHVQAWLLMAGIIALLPLVLYVGAERLGFEAAYVLLAYASAIALGVGLRRPFRGVRFNGFVLQGLVLVTLGAIFLGVVPFVRGEDPATARLFGLLGFGLLVTGGALAGAVWAWRRRGPA